MAQEGLGGEGNKNRMSRIAFGGRIKGTEKIGVVGDLEERKLGQ